VNARPRDLAAAGKDPAAHCREIGRCNQRGGRMLSIVDLLDAGTLDLPLAGYLLAAIGGGASFMVGARPGGAGKTTVMGALLNFVPPGTPLRAADGPATLAELARPGAPRVCAVCHEVGAGAYYAYLWGAELRAYFALAAAGHQLATNLHADTFDEARAQVCDQNGVRGEDFRRMNLLLFLRVGPGGARRIVAVHESDGVAPHAPVFGGAEEPGCVGPSRRVPPGVQDRAARFLADLRARGERRIEDVRAAVLARGSELQP